MAGLISLAIAVIIAVLLVVTLVSPSPQAVSYPAVLVSGGTIVSVIVLGAILLGGRR